MPVSVMAPTNSDTGPVVASGDGGWAVLARWLSRATFGAIVLMAICFAGMAIRSVTGMSFSGLANPGDPGWVGVAALIVMALGFQFVDMSAWQRLQAIGGNANDVQTKARRGLLVFAIESPFSWVLCLALGTMIITSLPEIGMAADKAGPMAAYPRMLIESGSALQIAVATLFMTAVMGVMLSTIDSVILAAMYAFVADVRNCEFKSAGAGQSEETTRRNDRADLLAGKKAAFIFVVAIFSLMVIAGGMLGKPEQLIGIMVGFYGGMLSLLPAVTAMLCGYRRWNGTAIAIGMAAGAAAAVGFTVWGLSDPSKAWYAVFAAPGLATVVTTVLSPLMPRPGDAP